MTSLSSDIWVRGSEKAYGLPLTISLLGHAVVFVVLNRLLLQLGHLSSMVPQIPQYDYVKPSVILPTEAPHFWFSVWWKSLRMLVMCLYSSATSWQYSGI